MRPRWKRCIIRTDAALGEILGKAYVAKNFTPEAKVRALEMVGNIRAELRERLGKLAWMTDATKEKAFAKLDAIVNKIGYPDRWRDYAALRVEPVAFATNATRAAAFQFRRDLGKIGKPVAQRDRVPCRDHAAAVLRSPGGRRRELRGVGAVIATRSSTASTIRGGHTTRRAT